MTRRKHKAALSLALAGGLGLVPSSCTDRNQTTPEECYPLDPLLDHPDNDGTQFCGIEPGELPEPKSGFSETRTVFVAVPLEDGPCDRCDSERLDGLLRAKVEAECDLPYELEPLCYAPGRDGGAVACWVQGLYYSDCDVVAYPPR